MQALTDDIASNKNVIGKIKQSAAKRNHNVLFNSNRDLQSYQKRFLMTNRVRNCISISSPRCRSGIAEIEKKIEWKNFIRALQTIEDRFSVEHFFNASRL